MKKVFVVLSSVILLSLLLTACGAPSTTFIFGSEDRSVALGSERKTLRMLGHTLSAI